jgi:hypothetical protein
MWRYVSWLGGTALILAFFQLAVSCCYAQEQIASVRIYRVKIRDVCGTPTYTSPPSCKTFTASDFEELEDSGALAVIYETDPVPPTAQKFSNGLVRDSRVYDLYSGSKTDAALVVVTWSHPVMRRVEVKRRGADGANLSIDETNITKATRGRFFYHFPFEQAGRLILMLRSRSPAFELTYSP